MNARIEFSLADGVGTLLLRPAVPGKPPTLDCAVIAEFRAAVARAASAQPRVLLVRSGEPKYFCVGADVKELRRLDRSTIDDWIVCGHRAFAELEDLPFPTVACVQGYALGGGLELALACDVIYADASARFGQTEARLGFVPGWGGSWRLPRRIGAGRAKDLAFTARIVDAAEAFRHGLVDRCVEAPEFESAIEGLVTAVRQNSGTSLRETKGLIAAAAGISRSGAEAAEVAASRRVIVDPDTLERVQAFLNRKS